MDSLLACWAGRLPIARFHNSIIGSIAGARDGTQSNGNGLPGWAMSGSRPGEGMSDLVQERVKYRFGCTVYCVILSYFNAFCLKLAYAQATPGIGKSEGPVMQAVLRHFSFSNSFQFFEIHEVHL